MEHRKKSELQAEAAQKWLKAGRKATIEAPTGWGKNFVSFLAIDMAIDDEDDRPILILAEVTDREATYFEDLDKYDSLFGKDLKNSHKWVFACYQSAYKWQGKDFKMVVAD